MGCSKGMLWVCNVDGPSLKFCWHVHDSICMVEIHVPDKSESIYFIFLHSYPPCLKLEALVIDMESEGYVSFPHQRVANLLVCMSFSLPLVIIELLVIALENCLGVSIQSLVLNVYMGWRCQCHWDGCQGAVGVAFHWTWWCATTS